MLVCALTSRKPEDRFSRDEAHIRENAKVNAKTNVDGLADGKVDT